MRGGRLLLAASALCACTARLETRDRTVIVETPCLAPGDEQCQTHCASKAAPNETLVFCATFVSEALQERLGYLHTEGCHWETTACSFRGR